ncbi:MAG: hypothetical protein V1897_02750 [Pseudomonadota bacterium]
MKTTRLSDQLLRTKNVETFQLAAKNGWGLKKALGSLARLIVLDNVQFILGTQTQAV